MWGDVGRKSVLHRFGVMTAFGFVGILGLGLANLGRLLAVGIRPARAWQPVLIPLAIPFGLVVAGSITGVLAHGKTEFRSFVDGWARTRESESLAVQHVLIAGGVGITVGLVVLGYDFWTGIGGGFATSSPDLFLLMSVGRLLYLGIAQEIVFRWGLLSAIVYAGLTWFRISGEEPTREYVIPAGIVIVAILLAVVRVSGTMDIGGAPLDAGLALAANFLPGVVFGALFWRYSLEAAMAAHIASHLPLIAVSVVV